MIFDHTIEFGNLPKDEPIILRDYFKLYAVVYETMKLNRVEIAKQCGEIKLRNEQIKNKLIKHQKTEKIFENGLTNNSKLKITINGVHNSLFDKEYVLNTTILGEGSYKEIQIKDENIGRKFKM